MELLNAYPIYLTNVTTKEEEITKEQTKKNKVNGSIFPVFL
jgi:hypothetical protein